MPLKKRQISKIVKIWASNVLFSQQIELIEDLRTLSGLSCYEKEILEIEVFKIVSKLSLDTVSNVEDILESLNLPINCDR